MGTFKNNHNHNYIYIYLWVQIKLGVRITTYIFFKPWVSKYVMVSHSICIWFMSRPKPIRVQSMRKRTVKREAIGVFFFKKKKFLFHMIRIYNHIEDVFGYCLFAKNWKLIAENTIAK